jgi:hypothetical protein
MLARVGLVVTGRVFAWKIIFSGKFFVFLLLNCEAFE